MWFRLSDFLLRALNIHQIGVLTALFGCYVAYATWNCCRLGARSVCPIQPCTSLQCHFTRRQILRAHLCLAVSCHLHFWHNDWDLLRATAVTWGWNGYQNKSQQKVDPGEGNSTPAPAGILIILYKSGPLWLSRSPRVNSGFAIAGVDSMTPTSLRPFAGSTQIRGDFLFYHKLTWKVCVSHIE